MVSADGELPRSTLMTPERWRVVDSLSQAALARDPLERPSFLTEACGDDAALRREVESLLAADSPDDFLEHPALAWSFIAGNAPHLTAGATEPGVASADHVPPPEALAAALAGRYEVERELGRGGMATVYLARDVRHRRLVAVKVLRPALSVVLGPERFLREIELTASLQHPHVLPLFDSGAADGLLYYVMPYVAGETLRARLAREPQLSEDDAVRLLCEVASALDYAHRRGVVHRDIKPANILLADGHAVVADFGIARALRGTGEEGDAPGAHARAGIAGVGPLTDAGTSPGTPGYMAPEQACGGAGVDHRADLYSLGVVAYELLAGAPPFAGRGPHQVVAAHIDEAPLRLAERAAHASPALAALVMRCLEKDPARRPQSAAELLAALESTRASSGGPPSAPPDRRLRRRTRTALAAGAAAMLVVLVMLAALAAERTRGTGRGPAGPPVVAVLPFENLGPPGDAYFADGLTDELTGRLALVSGLRVIAWASARQYKGTTKSPQEIARELGATYLLMGTVRLERATRGESERVRVRPELVRAADQARVWAEPLEGRLQDVSRLQALIAERVVGPLDVALLAQERRATTARPTANVAAYDAYLRGLAGLERSARYSFAEVRRAAVAELERATQLDPGFAAAYARLADAYLAEEFVVSDPATLEKAHANAERAWMLDSTLLESRLARAAYLMRVGDPGRAQEVVSAAAAAAPGDAETQLRLAEAETALGRPERGIPSAERAMLLDPRSPEPPAVLAELYHRAHRFAESVSVRERELALAPRNMIAYWAQMICYLSWRADTVGARRVAERGGPALESWLIRLPNDPGAYVLWHKVLGPSVWRAKDTLSFAGYLANDGGFPPELYLLMKLRHAAFMGRPGLVRAYADSVVVRLEPELRRAPDASLYSTYSRRSMLAEGYARLGRARDAAREIDRHLAEARGMRIADALHIALVNAAYIDVLIGRRDLAVARLTEVLRLPSGYVISRALLRADPVWAPLRGLPGFERLLARP